MDAATALQAAMHDDWGRLLGGLLRRYGRPDLVEDALAEAFAQAVEAWTGALPVNPTGWLRTAADRRMLDVLRREAVAQKRAHLLDQDEGPRTSEPVDDRLAMLFMCTHPALSEEVRPALALRFVLGVPTDVIARLFLVPVSTMAARLTRAKKRLASSGIPLRVPEQNELPGRVDDVARAIYLAFTAGYAPSSGDDVVRLADAGEAVRLALLAEELAPGGARVQETLRALSALLLLQHARRDARSEGGRIVLLADQDRRRWRSAEIDAGMRRLESLAPTTGYAEQLRLQAVIAACHDGAATASETDWRTIATAYHRLESLTGSPVVRLNRAVALAEVSGPMAGLALLRGLDDRLPGHHRVSLVRAELLRRDRRMDEAREAYAQALRDCPDGAEARHVAARLASLLE